MYIFLIMLVLLVLAVWLFMRSDKFGAAATDPLLKAAQRAPQYRNGAFQNQHTTPDLAEGVTYTQVMKEYFFKKHPHTKPAHTLPYQKSALNELSNDQPSIVWFGHSSYLLQVDGKTILVDPVFSKAASPVFFANKSFAGTQVFSAADMPAIDFLVITHDHWDHLDYATVLALKPKVKQVITSLGVGAHLVKWGYAAAQIFQGAWNELLYQQDGFSFTATPARHFSGRGFKRNQTAWSGFVLQTPTQKIYLGGDSGYDSHFKDIGEAFGPFDLAILECGQYNAFWKYIHMLPEETVQAAIELKARVLLPVHWGKFALSMHPWNEPINRAVKAAEGKLPLLTPMVGQAIAYQLPMPVSNWWNNV